LTSGYAFLNGIHDSSNIVATMISSRAFSPRVALGVTAVAEFLGPFVFGVAVAQTIGRDIVAPETINLYVLIAGLASAIVWNLFTWLLGFPSSSSHALIGGFMGAVIIGAGWSAIRSDGLIKILIALFGSPIIGLFIGFIINRLVSLACWKATPRISTLFKRSQILSAVVLALSHGSNDPPKSMGIITLALVLGSVLPTFQVPLWVIALCASMVAFGTALGGWRLIRTVGGKFYKIRPMDGFSSQLTSAFVIFTASLFGGPVSTTQVVSSAIMGVGASDRINKVRWGVARDIAMAWLFTIPITALIAAGIYWLFLHILHI
jgi:PiT family inorganic phosphate transporter